MTDRSADPANRRLMCRRPNGGCGRTAAGPDATGTTDPRAHLDGGNVGA